MQHGECTSTCQDVVKSVLYARFPYDFLVTTTTQIPQFHSSLSIQTIYCTMYNILLSLWSVSPSWNLALLTLLILLSETKLFLIQHPNCNRFGNRARQVYLYSTVQTQGQFKVLYIMHYVAYSYWKGCIQRYRCACKNVISFSFF